MTVATLAAMFSGVIIYIVTGKYDFITLHLLALALFPLVLVANLRFNYIWAMYIFFIVVFGLMLLFFHKMGKASEAYLFIVPLLVCLLMLLGRREIYKHMMVIFGMFFAFMGVCAIGYFAGWFNQSYPPAALTVMRIVNMSFSSALTLTITYIIIGQNLRQERELKALIREKETLLAEVHHRVKNNMAITSSLLNMRMERCGSEETREALEDCKNKIYSMALIHKKVYASKTLKDIDFREYISELAEELVSAYKEHNEINLNIDAADCTLPLDSAIPCGFIINELMTNSFKYAIQKAKELTLNISMIRTGNEVQLTASDNGPGLSAHAKNENSLGMTLIDILCRQLEATYSFKNDNGLVFEMNFRLPK